MSQLKSKQVPGYTPAEIEEVPISKESEPVDKLPILRALAADANYSVREGHSYQDVVTKLATLSDFIIELSSECDHHEATVNNQMEAVA